MRVELYIFVLACFAHGDAAAYRASWPATSRHRRDDDYDSVMKARPEAISPAIAMPIARSRHLGFRKRRPHGYAKLSRRLN